MDSGRSYSREELEAFAARRGVGVSSASRAVSSAAREAAAASAHELFEALRFLAEHPRAATDDITRELCRCLKEALQDAGRAAIDLANWRAAWDLWAHVMTGAHRPSRRTGL